MGWPVAATTAREAAAGARASTTRWLQRVSRRAEERVGTLGTWRARGSYWSERKSSGARGSPAMAMAGARCLRGRQLRHENEQGVRWETEWSSQGLRRWPRGARGGVGGGESTAAVLGGRGGEKRRDGASGLLRSREPTERSREALRSSGARRVGEGVAVAARAARVSDGGARPVVCERDGEGERRWERSRGFQGVGAAPRG